MIIVFCAQIVMLNIWLSLTQWTRAVIALLGWLGLAARPRPQRAAGLAAALACLLVAEHVLPWHWQPGAPLADVLGFNDSSGPSAVRIARHVITHFYYVGALVWLAAIAGLGTLRATGAVICLCVAVTLLETRLSGHTPCLPTPH